MYIYILKSLKKISIIPLGIGIFVNIYCMLVASICTGLIHFFLNSYYTGKKLGYTSWMQLKDVAPSYGIGFAIALSVYFLKFLPLSNWIILPIQLVVGVGVFFLICETTKLPEYLEVKEMALEYIVKFKQMLHH